MAGVGAVGLVAASFASPAAAAVVAGCGAVPAGASSTVTNGVCQLDFDTAGTYSWTLPAGISGLYALIVGAGGGADANGLNEGYAGSGGDVAYADYTTAAADDVANLTVGAPGTTAEKIGTDGGDSSMTLGLSSVVAVGGIGGAFDIDKYCFPDGDSFPAVGSGNGAGGPVGNGGDCATAVGPGVNPSLGNVDSFANAAPVIFADLNVDFGRGGQVVVAPAALPDPTGTGQGASVRYVSPAVRYVSPTVPEFNAIGGGGRIIYRYTLAATEENVPQLASTGQNVAAPLGVGAVLAALGAATLFASSRRRRTRTPS